MNNLSQSTGLTSPNTAYFDAALRALDYAQLDVWLAEYQGTLTLEDGVLVATAFHNGFFHRACCTVPRGVPHELLRFCPEAYHAMAEAVAEVENQEKEWEREARAEAFATSRINRIPLADACAEAGVPQITPDTVALMMEWASHSGSTDLLDGRDVA